MQKADRRKRRKKRLAALTVLTGCLLIMNILLFIATQQKAREVDELLNHAAARLKLSEEEEDWTATEYQVADSAVSQEVQTDYPELWGLDWVDSPVERTERQVLDKLEELAEESSVIQEIYNNCDRYPDKLLEALANNPEMAGFVAGYPDREKAASGGLTASEKEKEFPLFLQWDPRWGYKEYGDNSIIGVAGCGPTCISMVLYYLTGNENLTPDIIADYGMKNGYYVSGVGTAWALLEDVPVQYGLSVSQMKIREENMIDVLDEGGVLICSMREGDFTASGHFIVIYGYDSEGFHVNDPNCVARSRMHWTWDKLEGQIKNLWAYGIRN